jgi:hypothetical protein
MIKTSQTGYVTIKRYNLYGEKAVPTGQVRENNGVTEAEFFLITSANPDRKVWLSKPDLYTGNQGTPTH